MRHRLWHGPWVAAAALAALCLPAPLPAETPLSAIDWLSGSTNRPAGLPTTQIPPRAWRPGDPVPAPPVPALRDDIAQSGAVGAVTTLRLGEVHPDRLGLIPAAQAGLPPALWQGMKNDALVARIRALPLGRLGALDALIGRVLTASLRPPADGDGALFLARVDRLLDMGALAPAAALLAQAGPGDGARFRRRFDIALLQGDEDRACARLRANPGLAPGLSLQIFCLARQGDWQAAATAFAGAEALALIPPDMAELTAFFLDPALADHAAAPIRPPSPLTPLGFRMMEAIGEPVPTAHLPLAFAWTDLSGGSGWRAQVIAAERLTRAGALPASRLFEIYGAGKAAASGGVWERVAAVARLDRALSDDGADLPAALITAARRMAAAGLSEALAHHIAARLRPHADTLSGAARGRALELGLLGPAPQDWAGVAPPDPRLRALQALAQGRAPETTPDALTRLLSEALIPPLPAEDAPSGPVLLTALEDLAAAAEGDLRRLPTGLTGLRRLGLDHDARRIGLAIALGGTP